MVSRLTVHGQTPSTADAAMAALARIARGDVAPLRELFQSHGPRLLALVLGILKNRAESEEVVQEVFLEVWKRASEYDSKRGAVGGWLVVLARTRAIDRLRSRNSAERALTAHPSEPLLRSSEEPSPLQAAESQQERDVVRAVLAQLPEAQRMAIQLSYFEGLSQREIAESRGEPLGTVKTRVRLALEKLHALLEGKGLR